METFCTGKRLASKYFEQETLAGKHLVQETFFCMWTHFLAGTRSIFIPDKVQIQTR